MPSNKNRLYVALYARGGQPKMKDGEDTYHWALIIGPKTEPPNARGLRFHAKEGPRLDGTTGWQFEERDIRVIGTQMLLVRICVGKIKNDDRAKAILRQIPIRDDRQDWNCVHWVAEALESLNADGKAVGTSELQWQKVRDAAMWYVQQKKDQHRFDGKGSFDMTKAATFDILEQKETVP